MLIIKKCEYCGIDFNVRVDKVKKGLARYCSMKCRGRAYSKSKRVELICPVCGKEFNTIPGRIKPNLINYCSRKCYDIKQKGKIPWNKNKKISKNWVKSNCIGCGKEFLYHTTSSSLGKYCSYECVYKYRRGKIHPSWKPKIERFCLVCGKKMMLTKQDKRILCSSKCQYKYLSGANNVNWLEGAFFEPYSPTFSRELKELIRHRDGYKCQKCGMPEMESIRKLDIHHIDYDKKNSLPSNLISLCISCNTKANANRIYWTKYFQKKVKEIMSADSMQLHFRFQKKMKLDKLANKDLFEMKARLENGKEEEIVFGAKGGLAHFQKGNR